jgi:alanine racemase
MTQLRPTWADVDLDAVRANVRALRAAAGDVAFMAVVKADGYGHGAVPVARAALDAGADWLGVALVEEGLELRAAGIDARILVLSQPPVDAVAEVVAQRLTPVVYTRPGIDALAKAVAAGAAPPLPVHLKVDTGMHRVGCAPEDAVAVAQLVGSYGELELEGVCTHLAVADELDNPYTGQQLARFDDVLAQLGERRLRPPIVHAANSAGLICHPASRHNLVRAGIALYGIPPAPALAGRVHLVPAMTLRSHVGHVKALPAGTRLSYGLRYEMERAGQVATVPVGYADGVPRALAAAGGEVLIGGRRRRLAGTVTMDQILVDVGDDAVEPGDEVVLIGSQGAEEITADDWAQPLGTVGYEIVCGISRRVPRRYP